jgi:hypothetical protein
MSGWEKSEKRRVKTRMGHGLDGLYGFEALVQRNIKKFYPQIAQISRIEEENL